MRSAHVRERLQLKAVERRRAQRIRIQVPVFVRGVDVVGADFVELTKTLNISADGASIAATRPMRPEQVVQLTFPAPSPALSSMVPNETPPISARVKREQPSGDLRVLGLEFLRPLE